MRRFLLILVAFSGTAYAHEETVLPLGDSQLSTFPKVGYVFSCPAHFGGGGAFRDGPWINGGSWYPDRKIHVNGAVNWPDSRFNTRTDGTQRVITANGLPDVSTGIFPVQETDPAYRYDRNPNHIRQHSIMLSLPLNPQPAASPSCVNMGMIGILVNGTPLFNALDGQGRDAMAHEVQDRCNGHPERSGEYHYHGWSDCLPDASGKAEQHSDLVGYAIDGFGIYGPVGENGKPLTTADLDECHGHTHTIIWDGEKVSMYHYHFTRDYPYSIGCFRGTPIAQHRPGAMRGERQPLRHDDFPPPSPPGF